MRVVLLLSIIFLNWGCKNEKRPWNKYQPKTPEPTLLNQSVASETPSAKKVVYSDIKPLFQKHCMLCHQANPLINWLDYTVAKQYADDGRLYNRIWELKDNPSQGMPLGNVFNMTANERSLIVQWIKDGAIQ